MSAQVRPGCKLTEVGVIPEDWDVRQIIDTCDFIVPGRNKPNVFDGNIPWITTPDLTDGGSVYESRLGLRVSESEAKNIGSKIVPAGSILMSCVGELGLVAYAENDIVINQQLHAFIPSACIDGKFLSYAIKTRVDYLYTVATKTALPYLNKDNCNSIKIPFPRLQEQRAIAVTLSDMDALISGLDQLIAKKRDIKQAAMQQLLTGQQRLPGFSGEWKVKPLRSVLSKARLGGNYVNQDTETKFPLMKMGNLDRGYFDLSKVQFIMRGVTPDPIHRLVYGDVLFNTRNTLDLVGKVAIWRDELPIAYYNSNLMRLEFDTEQICSNEYANYALNTASMVSGLREMATGSTSVAAIYTRDLMRLQVLVPPLPEQAAIATILSDMDSELATLEARRDKARQLKQGMMQELLTGRIRLSLSLQEAKLC